MPDLRASLASTPSLRVRHSLDDRGSSLTVEDLTVVHGLHRYSVPTLVALERESFAPSSSRSSVGLGSSVGLNSTARSSVRSSLAASGAAGVEGHSSPDHELANTRVKFLGVTRHEGPGGKFCEFLVQVDTGKEQFVVRKRYSEFRDLRHQLLAALKAAGRCKGGACGQLESIAQLKFPRRKLSLLSRSSTGDLDTARDRVVMLQSFVETVLRVYRHAPKRQVRCCFNNECQLLGDVRAFLELSGPLSLADSGVNLNQNDSILEDAVSARDVDWRDRIDSPPTGKLSNSTLSTTSTLSTSSSRASMKFNESQSGEALYTISEDFESLHVRA